jgi:hypothetical protein
MFSYWMNSYWGGAVAGIGGALVIGAYGRMVRGKQARRRKVAVALPWLFGVGAVILLLTRPYEGFLPVAPTAVALWLNTERRRREVWLPIIALGTAGFAWMAFYDYRVTGNPLRLPYLEYFAQYESVPPLIVLPVQHTKVSRHYDLEFLNRVWASDQNLTSRSWRLPIARAGDLYQTAGVIFGDPLWLLVLLGFAPACFVARRTRFLVILTGVLVAGATVEFVFNAHYAARLLRFCWSFWSNPCAACARG